MEGITLNCRALCILSAKMGVRDIHTIGVFFLKLLSMEIPLRSTNFKRGVL